ncbi:MAG: zinc metalloprotease HtpX [Actinomyces urogenitalis]|uniref:Protease HtpX homolog n=3 Tax=Actinomyces urogenitalis TaxID=103621 RepID=C0W887_9ACTO|nr:zinc metalloprotease HtpX [Actinomyces urogenitalis]ETJ06176.1 MAG: Protease HtpX-like protein [Actinomyces urogenitalis DORA_12]EEH65058.1 peptidase, M48 family [Actinomyces urogenitalis DSM 15434]KGF00238.1 protease HtpX [Actinomyces urogenitalis S6-C4]MBS5976535.1 zinc metalloprotease HtpX [Actinomyces urogenitalis]MDK8237556.1 zinc metalloprotease HtpX [Actinomyces urogenitalis]
MTGTDHHNGLKTAVLMGGLWSLLLLIGWLLAQGTGSSVWLFIMPAIGVAQTAYTYWNSDKLAVRSMGAIEVTPEQQPVMYAVVRELSTKAGQPMPRLYVAPTMSPNAFATGRNPEHAAVCCTQGILQLLNERELRGVLGHELSHVYNRDILTGSVAAGIAGVISSVAQMVLWFGGGRDRRDSNVLVLLLISILAPLAATLTQFAVSRTREYDADHDGAVLTGDPLALASALHKLETGVAAAPMAQEPRLEPVSSMMIANPFGRLRSLFATHPPMDKRIARLEQMAGY